MTVLQIPPRLLLKTCSFLVTYYRTLFLTLNYSLTREKAYLCVRNVYFKKLHILTVDGYFMIINISGCVLIRGSHLKLKLA